MHLLRAPDVQTASCAVQMPLLTNLQGFGDLEGDERVVGLAARQARLADDCQGQQRVVL